MGREHVPPWLAVLALVVDKFHNQHVDVSTGLGVTNDRQEDVLVAKCFGASACAVQCRNHLGDEVGYLGGILVGTIASADMLKSRRAEDLRRLFGPPSL